MKEQTTHTTPNIIRDENGVKTRSRIALIRKIKEWREQFEVIGFEGILRVRCKCGNELHYKTYEDIPRQSVDCDKCGYEGLLKYIGYTVPCPHCEHKNKFYDEYPAKDETCKSCNKSLNYDTVEKTTKIKVRIKK